MGTTAAIVLLALVITLQLLASSASGAASAPETVADYAAWGLQGPHRNTADGGCGEEAYAAAASGPSGGYHPDGRYPGRWITPGPSDDALWGSGSPRRIMARVHYDPVIPKWMGLNNMFYLLAFALQDGYHSAGHLQEKMGNNEYVAIILPKLHAEVMPFFNPESHIPARDPGMRLHYFSELFDMNKLSALFLERFNCLVLDEPTFKRLEGQGALDLPPKQFQRTFWENRTNFKIASGKYFDAMFEALGPSPDLRARFLDPCMAKVQTAFGGSPFMSVHLRVEDDWVEAFCSKAYVRQERQKMREQEPGERHLKCLGAGEVARTITNTPDLSAITNVLAMYAVDLFHADHPRRPDEMKPDPMQVWPENYTVVNHFDLGCFPEDQPLSYTERSVVSFFLAAAADAFSGTKSSTFSQGVARLRSYAADEPGRPEGGQIRESSYLYDCHDSWDKFWPYKAATKIHNFTYDGFCHLPRHDPFGGRE